MIVQKFEDYIPKPDKNYFSTSYDENSLSVIVPFYNEDAKAIQETLKSIYYCFEYYKKTTQKIPLTSAKIMLIQDGWHNSSESMREYLQTIFPATYRGGKWWESEDFLSPLKHTVTYILNSDDGVCINPTDDVPIIMDISLVIKLDNRKKHNSHEWFLRENGFIEASGSKYFLCTDAFTIFHYTCLYHLIYEMDNNDNVVVATGRQRVMSADMQGVDEKIFSVGYFLRQIQLFDFEMSNAVYNGAFSIGGFLPVIPGPCGLYRSSVMLEEDVRNCYFKLVDKTYRNTDIILGNLKIAEDRILSYTSVLNAKCEQKMSFVPLALFYFESENSLEKLLLQRRRWINGTVAGYLYLLFISPQYLYNWNANIFRKTYIIFLLLCQLFTYFLLVIAPAVSLAILNDSIIHIVGYMINDKHNHTKTIIIILGCTLFGLQYFFHNTQKYCKILFVLLLGTTIIISITSLLSIGLYLFERDNVANNTIYFMVGIGLLSLLNSLLISGRFHSTYYIIKSIPFYLLFSHMFISCFGAYSFSRIWDLSWGNRPDGMTISYNTRQEIVAITKLLKSKSTLCIWIILLLNSVVYFSNIFSSVDLKRILVDCFFGLATIQMSLSTLYLLYRLPTKIKYVNTYNKLKISLLDLIIEKKEEYNKIRSTFKTTDDIIIYINDNIPIYEIKNGDNLLII